MVAISTISGCKTSIYVPEQDPEVSSNASEQSFKDDVFSRRKFSYFSVEVFAFVSVAIALRARSDLFTVRLLARLAISFEKSEDFKFFVAVLKYSIVDFEAIIALYLTQIRDVVCRVFDLIVKVIEFIWSRVDAKIIDVVARL